MSNFFGFELIAETNQGLSDFKMAFEFVWISLPDADRNAIASKLKRVIWTDSGSTSITSDDGEEIAFVASRMVDDTPALVAISSALRRVWQIATSFEASSIAIQVASRVDQETFAKSIVGSGSGTVWNLIDSGLPTDDEFLMVAIAWPELSELKKTLPRRSKSNLLGRRFRSALGFTAACTTKNNKGKRGFVSRLRY